MKTSFDSIFPSSLAIYLLLETNYNFDMLMMLRNIYNAYF